MNTTAKTPNTKLTQSRFGTLMSELKQERDELLVQIKLGENELKDEWAHVEEKWHDLNRKAHAAGLKLHDAAGAAKEAGTKIDEAWDNLLKEIQTGYGHIRKKL